jgi:hypothetical protein
MSLVANYEPMTWDDDARLIEANINPRTGFATDYLNHFNEAIMLLELVESPELRDDFFAWRPKKYAEHFAASNSKYKDITITAYTEADPELRQRLDSLADSMNEILFAAREVMRQDLSGNSAIAIADLAVRWVKPLVARAGAVINGTDIECGATGRHTAPQVEVDALMAR